MNCSQSPHQLLWNSADLEKDGSFKEGGGIPWCLTSWTTLTLRPHRCLSGYMIVYICHILSNCSLNTIVFYCIKAYSNKDVFKTQEKIVVYTHDRMVLRQEKKNRNPVFYNRWIYLETLMLSEISQFLKDK